MPEGWAEFTGRELGAVLGVSAGDAEEMLDLAHALEVSLPGTKEAFRAGILNLDKAQVIAAATAVLDPSEARPAEAMVLDRAGSLTPAQLRARPAPASTAERHKPVKPGGPDPPGGPRFTFTRIDQPGPPGGYGTWRFSTGIPGQRDLLIAVGPLPTGECDHRHEARGHDPGVMLRHLAQVRHATCTGPGCRRPAANCDFEHNVPYETGGRTCLCNGNPTCRHDHRAKQDSRWKVEQLPSGQVRWTMPSGRQCVTEPTRYPI